jgi:hypothetical protein
MLSAVHFKCQNEARRGAMVRGVATAATDQGLECGVMGTLP